MSEDINKPEDLKNLQVRSLTIQRSSSWDKNAPWEATAWLAAKTGSAKELKIELEENIAQEIMKLLAPHIVKSASDAAQALADEAKRMAEALGDRMIKSIEDQK